ncbi:hypothetical protein [Sulfobacillus sp. hq2]|uniref:hypothetical protein n=1 Tax=Sulfobacillus sp. hq2 TaxID=2039167 RepID=UPI000CD290D1|nr:hypothetical protein [Sulfobacillus sp. hq2]POB09134.1 hypothetical protein CO251_16325 [Sulfobacillus sp. hq2]
MADMFNSLSLDEARQAGYAQGHAEGWQEGIEVGLHEGTLVALRAAVLRIVTARCGVPNDQVRLRIASETQCAQLYKWMDELVMPVRSQSTDDLWNA